MPTIYKIFRADEYAAFVSAGETLGAPIDIADGYVHMSTKEQVQETAAKHFSNETDLKLLALDSEVLGDALKWEPSRGGALFPHLYRALNIDDISATHDLPLVDGTHDFSGLLA